MTVRRVSLVVYPAVVLAVGAALIPLARIDAPARDSAWQVYCLEDGSVTVAGHVVTPPAICIPYPGNPVS